uniref:Uncharacterized protein n=1 Tax=Acrobeloides nanus TaxID=290746 RepID=A0A914CPG3_9BILA
MLGMFNCNADEGVEFYAARKVDANSNDADMKVFTEYKEKLHVTYTKDGRKLSNGHISGQQCINPPDQWKKLILSAAAKKVIAIERKNSSKNKKRRSIKKMKSCETMDSEEVPDKETK